MHKDITHSIENYINKYNQTHPNKFLKHYDYYEPLTHLKTFINEKYISIYDLDNSLITRPSLENYYLVKAYEMAYHTKNPIFHDYANEQIDHLRNDRIRMFEIDISKFDPEKIKEHFIMDETKVFNKETGDFVDQMTGSNELDKFIEGKADLCTLSFLIRLYNSNNQILY